MTSFFSEEEEKRTKDDRRREVERGEYERKGENKR